MASKQSLANMQGTIANGGSIAVQLYTLQELNKLKPKQAIRLLHFYLKLERKYSLEAKVVEAYINTNKLGPCFTLFTYGWHEIATDSSILMYTLGCLQIGWLLKDSDPGRAVYDTLIREQAEVWKLLLSGE